MLTSTLSVDRAVAKSFFASRDSREGIASILGSFSVGLPYGSQLDAARHAAKRSLAPWRFAGENRPEYRVVESLSLAERELLRRFSDYRRRELIARDALAELDAEILELTEKGETPTHEQCLQRNALHSEVMFWAQRAQNPQSFPLEVDGWAASPVEEGDLESLIASQKQDAADWRRHERRTR